MQSLVTATFTECLGLAHAPSQMLNDQLNRKHLEDTSIVYHLGLFQYNAP